MFGGEQKSQSHRQIINRTFFSNIGRRQIDGDSSALVRRTKTAVFNSRTYAIARFFDGHIRQADNIKNMQTGRDGIHFNFNNFAFEADGGGGKNFGSHAFYFLNNLATSIIAPKQIKISAGLKMGQKRKSMKSMTQPKMRRSRRLEMAPDRKRITK